MDITTLDEVHLKALGYEQVKLLQQTQMNIQAIEQELAKRKHNEVDNGTNTNA